MAKKPDIDEIQDLLDKPGDDFIESLMAVEGVVSRKKGNESHIKTASYIWQSFLQHERIAWYPMLKDPSDVWDDLNLDDEQDKYTRENPGLDHADPVQNRYSWLYKAAILLTGLMTGLAFFQIFQMYSDSGFEVNRKPVAFAPGIQTTDWYNTPTKIKMQNGHINLDKGFLIIGNNGKTKNTPDYVVITNHLDSVFDLKHTKLKIDHPRIKIQVTGTKFSVDLKEKDGMVLLETGNLAIKYIPDNGPPQELDIKAPHRLMFDQNQMYSQDLTKSRDENDYQKYTDSKNPNTNRQTPYNKFKKANHKKSPKSNAQNRDSSNRILHRFTLKNGKKYYGYIIEKDDQYMTIEDKNGRNYKLLVKDLFTADLLE